MLAMISRACALVFVFHAYNGAWFECVCVCVCVCVGVGVQFLVCNSLLLVCFVAALISCLFGLRL